MLIGVSLAKNRNTAMLCLCLYLSVQPLFVIHRSKTVKSSLQLYIPSYFYGLNLEISSVSVNLFYKSVFVCAHVYVSACLSVRG